MNITSENARMPVLKAFILKQISQKIETIDERSCLLKDYSYKNIEEDNKEFITVSPVEEDILCVLYPHKEVYGLGIIDTIDKVSNGKRKLAPNTLYPTLRRMEAADKGYITSRWGDERQEELVQRGGARRRYYKLTDKGRNILEQLWEYRESLLGIDFNQAVSFY